MKVLLTLGCWGRIEEGFIICNGVTNQVLDITKNSERNVSIKDYLDSHFRLFDRPLYNNVHTAIWNIQDKFSIKGNPVFNNYLFRRIEEFCIIHRKCGLFLCLKAQEGESNDHG
jgi:hypothetical protein